MKMYVLLKFSKNLGPVSERAAINRKFYTICHWATIDIHRTINRNPLWNFTNFWKSAYFPVSDDVPKSEVDGRHRECLNFRV